MTTETIANPDQIQAVFLADLHLSPSTPGTTEAFSAFLADEAPKAQSLYILGDLFEYWAGDDDIESPLNQQVLQAIRQLSDSGVRVFWTPGNRDFLTSTGFAEAGGMTFMPDLEVIQIGELKIALAHGDEQCLDDAAYVTFRATVRNPQWQQQFLAMPLAQRKALIESFRKDTSKENEAKPGYESFDLSASAIESVFATTGASVFIHGHIHRSGAYQHNKGIRYSLSDWNMDGAEKKSGWLELSADGSFVQRSLAV